MGTGAPLAPVPSFPGNGAETSSWQPLDRTAESYYRSKEPTMKSSLQVAPGMEASQRNSVVCLLLAFFLLYNPFLAAPRTGNGLGVCCPASHRATVGASELQNFASVAGQDFPGLADLAPAEVPVLLPALPGPISFHVSHGLYLPQQLLCASLWFRPPPVF
jgi:hypothetical protein